MKQVPIDENNIPQIQTDKPGSSKLSANQIEVQSKARKSPSSETDSIKNEAIFLKISITLVVILTLFHISDFVWYK